MITEFVETMLFRLALKISRKARYMKVDYERTRKNLVIAYDDLDSMGKIVDELIGGYELPQPVAEFQEVE